ncbi:MAG: mechanosensitive ion channel family protein [Chitinispirillales bacterium]|jgi:miniconductance mechanosensitive channel|nr:mechanosensitive ion channel family protein [Chitinispirillales bacterium]
MDGVISSIATLWAGENVIVRGFFVPAYTVKLAVLLLVAFVVHEIIVRLLLPVLKNLSRRTATRLDDIVFDRRLFHRAAHLIPALIIYSCLPRVLVPETEVHSLLRKAVDLYFVLVSLAVFDALLSAVRDVYDMHNKSGKVSINGVVQALKIIGTFVAIIFAVSLLAGKSPLYFVSGLGAFTAILMLIFKDPLLGLVAGVQLSTMDLVRKGDWIEIAKHGADGEVIDISLTTIRIQNWDKTIVSIPAYEFVSSSFKNWRGMSESGGRRIKRSMRFKISTVHFLTDEETERLRRIKLLAPHIEGQLAEMSKFNAEEFSGSDMSIPANGRRLTNIGTFRAYCDAYLRKHPGINQGMTIIVRHLEPTETGLPLELYMFTSDTRWEEYENVQAGIFDHLLSLVPVFGLEIYQR